MSITTTPATAKSTRTGGFLARFRRTEEVPPEMLEFFSPSASMIASRPYAFANRSIIIMTTGVLAALVIICCVNIDRIVWGNGKVVSVTPELVVAPLEAGVVKNIAVSNGDIVRKGQLLAQLDPTFTTADTVAAREQVDRYQTEVDRLQAELQGKLYKPAVLTKGALTQEGIYAQRSAARSAQLRYYQGQIDAQKALMAQADAQIRQYAKETGVAVDVQKMREELEKDAVGSRLDTLSAVSARLETEREVLFNIQQFENAKQMVASLQGQLESYNQQWFADASQNLTDDSVQLATYRDQLEHAAMNGKLIDLRAEQDATVLAVAPLSIGSVVQAGQTFFTLVPLNAPLEVDAQITADQSGFIAVGQPAQVKFITFPFTRFGEATGTVRLISADTYLTNSQQASSNTASSSGTTSDAVFVGTNSGVPYYHDVRITIDRVKLQNVPHDFHVTPGMFVEADIKVGYHTVFDYFVERIWPYVEESMREPT